MTQYLIGPKKIESSRAMSVVRDLGMDRFCKSQEKISERNLETQKEMRINLNGAMERTKTLILT